LKRISLLIKNINGRSCQKWIREGIIVIVYGVLGSLDCGAYLEQALVRV